jgi:hypothetical protein
MQGGPNYFTGTYNGICFYKRLNTYYMRPASSLTAETVRTSDKFRNSRKSAAHLAAASRLASGMYRSLPKEKREVTLYRKMTGVAKLMLKEGVSTEAIQAALQDCITAFCSQPADSKQLSKTKQKISRPKLTRLAPAVEWINRQDAALAKGIADDRIRYIKFSGRLAFEINPSIVYRMEARNRHPQLNLPFKGTG